MTNTAMTITNDAMPKATPRDRLKNCIIGAIEGFGITAVSVAAAIYGVALLEEASFTHNLNYGLTGVVAGFGGAMAAMVAGIHYGTKLFDENNLCKGCTAAFMAAGALAGIYTATHTNTAVAIMTSKTTDDLLTVERHVDEGLRQDFGSLVPKR